MDTLLSLQVLAAVAEHKSFTAVAERLGLSNAMTSKHVQHVEARVGARLLNRNSRNVSLTEAGTRYLAAVQPLLEGLREVEAQLSESTLEPQGTLKVSMPVWMANPDFARILADYREQNPKVILNLDLSGRLINLVEEGFDIALRAAFTLDEGLVARKVATVDFNLVASTKLLDKIGRPQSLEDLANAAFLAYPPMMHNGHVRFKSGETEIDIRFNPVLQSGNETLLLLAAREAMGFAFMPTWLVREHLLSGELETVLPELISPASPLYAIYPERSYLPAKVRSFLDFLAGPSGLKATS